MENNKAVPASDVSWKDMINRCRDGDTSAFREIMEMHYNYTYAVAFKVLRSEADAEDVVQETFVRIWKNISIYLPEKKFTTWLYRIVVNLCYDRLKMKSVRRENATDFSQQREEESATASGNAHTELEMKDLGSKIIEIAQTLPLKQRLVFTMRDLNDFSIGEISERTGMSASSVKANLSYARQYIRRKIVELEK
jgi:RNA polymerase sigma-70 factor (ECF subfamily)